DGEAARDAGVLPADVERARRRVQSEIESRAGDGARRIRSAAHTRSLAGRETRVARGGRPRRALRSQPRHRLAPQAKRESVAYAFVSARTANRGGATRTQRPPAAVRNLERRRGLAARGGRASLDARA